MSELCHAAKEGDSAGVTRLLRSAADRARINDHDHNFYVSFFFSIPFSILIINLLEEQSILLYILLRAYAYAYALACNCLCACLSFFLTGGDFSLKDFSLIRITCTWNPHTFHVYVHVRACACVILFFLGLHSSALRCKLWPCTNSQNIAGEWREGEPDGRYR